MKEETKELLFTIVGSIIIGSIVVVITIYMAGCAVQDVYDPNAPELKFLGATDPNFASDHGDTRETRELYNICLNRGLINRDRLVLAEVCKRMLVLESLHIKGAPRLHRIDPNEVKE